MYRNDEDLDKLARDAKEKLRSDELKALPYKMQEKLLYKMNYLIDSIGYSSRYQTTELRFKDYEANKQLSDTLLNVIEAYKEIKAIADGDDNNA